MDPIRLFSLISWIALPTVMFGGYSLLGLIARSNPWLTSFRTAYFRAGHAQHRLPVRRAPAADQRPLGQRRHLGRRDDPGSLQQRVRPGLGQRG